MCVCVCMYIDEPMSVGGMKRNSQEVEQMGKFCFNFLLTVKCL